MTTASEGRALMFHADVSRSGAKIRIAEAVPTMREHDPSADRQSQLVVER